MFWGFDLSLNHGAMVDLGLDGNVKWFGYVTNKQRTKEGMLLHHPNGFKGLGTKGQSVYFPVTQLHKQTREDPLSRNAIKLGWWVHVLKKWLAAHPPALIGIEDYAYSKAATQGSFVIAEVTGYLKALAGRRYIPMRLHDPKTVKLFGTLRGNADPDEVSEAAENWFPELKGIPRASFKDSPWHDVGAAAWVARMVWTEYQIRKGVMDLASLPEKQRQAFLRATKVRPTNVLGCEWIVFARPGVGLMPRIGKG